VANGCFADKHAMPRKNESPRDCFLKNMNKEATWVARKVFQNKNGANGEVVSAIVREKRSIPLSFGIFLGAKIGKPRVKTWTLHGEESPISA